MKANEVPLDTFLSQTKTQFVIPVYQRNYDWTEAQCRQLLSDIIEVGGRQGETHFIGSIVYIHDGIYTSSDVKQLVVIDGQQRLTTISLLYLALYFFASKNKMSEKANEIMETYIQNKFVKSESSRLKLSQSDSNAKAFQYLLSENDPVNYVQFSRVIENYCFFQKEIRLDNVDLILRGLSQLLFVEISLERGKDDPQKIFESLNSTGLELSQADLIRNYVLMGLDPEEQVRVFNLYWNVIEQNAKDADKEESKVSEFIRDYLTFKIKKIPKKDSIYNEFKNRFRERNQEFYLEVLQELKEYSFHYKKLLNPKLEEDKEVRKQLSYVNRLELTSSYPFLLPVYHDFKKGVISQEDLVEILRLLQSFVWRRFIFNLATNAHNKIFMTLYGDVDNENYLESIKRALIRKRGGQKFPNNKDIEIALKEKDLYNTQAKNRTYFFELLENFENREFVSVDNPDITIEHIFPQTPDESWYNSLDEESISLLSDKYLNTISNLTLSGNNGSLSNKSFLDKKMMNKDGKQQGYAFSRLWLNQYLREIDEWNLETLNSRYNMILDRFFKIWEFPTVELEDEIDTDQDYTIYNAPDPRHKKLDYFIFRDEKIVTEEVSKMYYHVISELFNENPSAFYHEDIKTLLGLTSNENDLRSPYRLNSNAYVESNIDNNSKFRRLRSLLGSLGYEEELLINFSNDEFEGADSEPKDRLYWENRGSTETLKNLDRCLSLLQNIDPGLDLNYTSVYVGLSNNEKVQNFVLFAPKRNFIWTSIKVDNHEGWVETLKTNNFKILSIGKRSHRIKFRITTSNLENSEKLLAEMFEEAYSKWMG